MIVEWQTTPNFFTLLQSLTEKYRAKQTTVTRVVETLDRYLEDLNETTTRVIKARLQTTLITQVIWRHSISIMIFVEPIY